MPLPRASAADTAGFAADVVGPLVARGVIARRPRVVGALDRMDADRRAVRRMQRLRARYGDGPLLLRVPGREVAVVLSPTDVHRVLEATPEPFVAANREKRAALSHFQPHGVLISTGEERTERRSFNEQVLDSSAAVHRQLGERMVATVDQEADQLLESARRAGAFGWDDFAPAWWRTVRRVALGDSAREDHEITEMLSRLRRDANWAYFKPVRKWLRSEFLARVRTYVERAEPGSLASLVASIPSSPRTFPHEQMPQWLFAFDAAGMASFRALALLAAHPDRVSSERGFLRACVLESVRLWPTTPALLRDTSAPTDWGAGTVAAGTALVIFAPFFHRDDERFAYAHSFTPELWTGGAPADGWPLIPFSEGPAECPGRNVVLHLTSSFLARIVEAQPPRLRGLRELGFDGRMPATLSPFRLTFEMEKSG